MALGCAVLVSCGVGQTAESAGQNQAMQLDAEELAELGMAGIYETVQPRMRALGARPEQLVETIDERQGTYAIGFRGRTYPILTGNADEATARGTATVVFFEIVNLQMAATPYRFYALNADNDLAGVFLTAEEYRQASSRGRSEDRPYIPTLTPPWFGQQHD